MHKDLEKRKAYMKSYYQENRERLLAKAKENYDPLAKSDYDKANNEARVARQRGYRSVLKDENPSLYIWKTVRARALSEGIEFNISPKDIVIPSRCPIFPWLELSFSDNRPSDNSPSLDRIDSSLGYVQGNVHVISYKANTIKNNATLNELQLLTEYLKKVMS